MLIKRYNIYLHISNYNFSTQARACLPNYSYKHLYTYQKQTVTNNAPYLVTIQTCHCILIWFF